MAQPIWRFCCLQDFEVKIILATQNQGKLKEFQQLSKGKGFEFIAIPPGLEEMPEETGNTFKENALIKAKHVSEYFQMPALADDSGLEVDALNGEPGVYSARYAGENCTYLDNVNKMLLEMKDVPENKRSATFSTVMAYVDDKRELTVKGVVEGIITDKIKGTLDEARLFI